MTVPANNYSISQNRKLAKYTMAVTVMMTGVAAHKIRKFEEYGLCRPSRTGSRQRLYSDHDIEQIQKIAQLTKKGVNLPGIKVILRMDGHEAVSEKDLSMTN